MSVITPTDIGEDSYLLGPRYVFHFNRFHPYVKGQLGLGVFKTDYDPRSGLKNYSNTYKMYSLAVALIIVLPVTSTFAPSISGIKTGQAFRAEWIDSSMSSLFGAAYKVPLNPEAAPPIMMVVQPFTQQRSSGPALWITGFRCRGS